MLEHKETGQRKDLEHSSTQHFVGRERNNRSFEGNADTVKWSKYRCLYHLVIWCNFKNVSDIDTLLDFLASKQDWIETDRDKLSNP